MPDNKSKRDLWPSHPEVFDTLLSPDEIFTEIKDLEAAGIRYRPAIMQIADKYHIPRDLVMDEYAKRDLDD
jgi:hypothetical protein